MPNILYKSVDVPDEKRDIPLGRVDLVTVGPIAFARGRFEPGWRWTTAMRPSVGGDLCQQHHNGYVLSGHMRVEYPGGESAELGPGDVFEAQPGHDACVVGEEPCVVLDFSGHLAGQSAS